MDVKLYNNRSVHNTINKDIALVGTYTAVRVVNPTDDFEVSIRMTVPTGALRWSAVNYFEYDGAFYYLQSVTQESNAVSVLNGTMDVLETWRAQILSWTAILERSTTYGTDRAIDELALFTSDSERTKVTFPNQIRTTESAGRYITTTSQQGFGA